jgi:Abnormal spindle-like microcephaly-assoc'd, ASPM-SPD-2-Hydin
MMIVKNTEPKVGRYLLGLLLTTGVLVGCGGGAGSAMKPAGSTDAAQLAVSPSSLDFGSVLVGDSKALPGTLTASNASVTVSSAAWSGEGYAVSGITFPTVVPTGQTLSFTVTFAPQAAGSSAGSINFVSSASNSPEAETFSGYGSQSSTHSVNLSWSPSSSPVVGYNVYRGTRNGGPYPVKLTRSPQSNTSYDDVTVQSGMTYYYVATAVNSDRTESSYSNQTTAAIP